MAPAPTLDVEESLGDLSNLPPSEAVLVICSAIIVGLPSGLKGSSSCTCLYHGKTLTFDESHDPDVIKEWLEDVYPRNVVRLADYKRVAVDKGRE